MLEIERPLDNRRAAADWTLQFQTTPKGEEDCPRVALHMTYPQISQITQN